MTIHARITAYKDIIVCELVAEASIPNEVVTTIDTPGNIGQVIMNTKEHLGVSKEALELLKTVKKGHDSLGDVDWFSTMNGAAHAFGWIGGPYAIKDPKTCEASRQYVIGEFVEIPNDVPEGAKQAIDAGDTGDDEEDEVF